VDSSEADKAMPDVDPEAHLGEETVLPTHGDSAGSLLSIKVRRRTPPRSKSEFHPRSSQDSAPHAASDPNPANLDGPLLPPAPPTLEAAIDPIDHETRGRDDHLDPGPKTPAEPPRRRRPDEIVTYWSQLRAGRHYPSLADVDLARIAADWPNSLMIRRRAGSRVLEAEHIGGARSSSSRPAWNEDDGETAIELSPMLLQWLLSLAGEVIKTKRPMGDTESFPSLRKSVLYRAFALPLSDDQKEIGHILCHVCLEE